jgi:hypothetical protein
MDQSASQCHSTPEDREELEGGRMPECMGKLLGDQSWQLLPEEAVACCNNRCPAHSGQHEICRAFDPWVPEAFCVPVRDACCSVPGPSLQPPPTAPVNLAMHSQSTCQR